MTAISSNVIEVKTDVSDVKDNIKTLHDKSDFKIDMLQKKNDEIKYRVTTLEDHVEKLEASSRKKKIFVGIDDKPCVKDSDTETENEFGEEISASASSIKRET